MGYESLVKIDPGLLHSFPIGFELEPPDLIIGSSICVDLVRRSTPLVTAGYKTATLLFTKMHFRISQATPSGRRLNVQYYITAARELARLVGVSTTFAISLIFLISMPKGVFDPGIPSLAVTFGVTLNIVQASVSENGHNWSRQLVCLARVQLKKREVMVLDEATTSVDTATNNVINQTLRQQFLVYTVIIIAHRITSVLDTDMVLHLDQGHVLEFNSPTK